LASSLEPHAANNKSIETIKTKKLHFFIPISLL
jgi:hypothetical protein